MNPHEGHYTLERCPVVASVDIAPHHPKLRGIMKTKGGAEGGKGSNVGTDVYAVITIRHGVNAFIVGDVL
jgi:hypothetical protein